MKTTIEKEYFLKIKDELRKIGAVRQFGVIHIEG